jgi:large conductance mechanosensitive channel
VQREVPLILAVVHARPRARIRMGAHSREGATMLREFLAFLKQYGVVGLAIAVIIGGKLNELVGSIVNDLIVPLILQPALRAANVDDIRKLSAGGILYGKVLGSGIEFLVVSMIVFLFAKKVLKEETVVKK